MTFNDYIEKAKSYIREYHSSEFCIKGEILDEEVEELDIRKVPMGYTTVTDDEIEIQGYVDLELMLFWREVNRDNGWERLDLTVFSTKDQMLEFLQDFTFDDVYILDGARLGDILIVGCDFGSYRFVTGEDWEGNKE